MNSRWLLRALLRGLARAGRRFGPQGAQLASGGVRAVAGLSGRVLGALPLMELLGVLGLVVLLSL